MSDAFWTAIFVAISTIIVAWIQSRIHRRVKTIHTLVNSAMGVQLSNNAELSRWKADREPANLSYAAAADKAEQLYLEHEQQQAKVEKQ